MISAARGRNGHGSDRLVLHQYRWAGVVWVAPCRDGVMSWADRPGEKGGASCLQVGLLAHRLPRRHSRRACVCTYVHVVHVCVYMCVYVYIQTCIYVYMCMCTCMCICMHVYTCVYVCVCIFVHRLWVSVGTRWRVVQCHWCACVPVFVCIFMRMHMCVCIYMCIFSAVSVVSTFEEVFWALVHVQTYTLYRCLLDINVHRDWVCDTLAVECAHMCMCIYICMLMHMYMDTYVRLSYCLRRRLSLRRCCWDFLSVYRCAYTCICICVCMYASKCACAYVCICTYVCLCICMLSEVKIAFITVCKEII